MPKLLGDSDVDAFRSELGGVSVPHAVGVDALVDASEGGEATKQMAHVDTVSRARAVTQDARH